METRRRWVGWIGLLMAALAMGCGSDPSATSGGSGGAGVSGGSTGSTGGIETGGHGGSGGSGGNMVCTPGSSELCAYSGDPANLGKGVCHAGHRVCNLDGLGFGPCQGEVLPTGEVCGNKQDEDCDGEADDGCVCVPGADEPCYTGPLGTDGIGVCLAGTHTCNADGLGHGACIGEVLPGVEGCDGTKLDEDCDGEVNESGASCVCVPELAELCYEGPLETQGVGNCKAGVRTCASDGQGYGSCVGQVLPAPESCGVVDADCDGVSLPPPLCPGQHLWSKRFGGLGSEEVFGLAVDSAGNMIVAGRFDGTTDFGGDPLVSAGGTDIFVVKYAPDGQHIWSKRFGASMNDEAGSIVVDASNNVLLTGSFQSTVDFGGGPLLCDGDSDGMVVKLNASGQHLWSKRFGGGLQDAGSGVATDSFGNVLLTGYFSGTADFGGGPFDSVGGNSAFIVKYNPAGQHLWSRQFGGVMGAFGDSVAVNAANEVVLAAGFAGTATFGGGMLVSGGTSDIVLAKYDAAGQHLWSESFGGTGFDVATALAIDNVGNVVLTGVFEGTATFGAGSFVSAGALDLFVAKYDPAGQHLWSERFGGTKSDGAYDLTVDATGNVLVTGIFEDTADFGGAPFTCVGISDMFVAKYTSSGQHLWSKHFGGGAHTSGWGIVEGSASEVLVAGIFRGTLDLGGGPLISPGSADGFFGPTDGFLMRLVP